MLGAMPYSTSQDQEERKTLKYPWQSTEDPQIARLDTIKRLVDDEYDLLEEPGDIYPAETIVPLDPEK